jgi:outer membrane lipopolysaccharide assembly protein LptE/RlpB
MAGHVKYYLTVIVLFFFLVAGCGYHFSSAGEHIDKGIQTVFVDNFSNRTSEARIENYFRNQFIDEFRKGNRFKIVDRKELSNAIFRGSINSLSTSHLSYSKTDLTKEDRVTVTMEVFFEERKSKKVIWHSKNLSGSEEYKVAEGSPTTTDTYRRNAIKKLANDMAEKAYRYIMSGF